MSITDLTLAYLWFVLAVACVLIVRGLAAPDGRQAWNELKEAWRGLLSVNKEQRALETDIGQVKAWLEVLLRSGFDCAFVIIHDRGSERFIQFRKYIQGVGDYGLELGFPNVVWSKDYYPMVRAYCEENAIPHRMHIETSCGTREFLYVNCGKDLELAFELTKAIWTKIFGLPEHARHRIQSHGVSPWNELVDRPEQRPLSFKQGFRHQHGTEPPSLISTSTDGVLACLLPVAFFGLVATLLNSQSGARDWSLDLGGVYLSGSLGSLVFFCLYVCCVSRLWFRRPKPRSGSWFDAKFLPVWGRTVTITLPISSVLIWTG